MDEAVCKRNWTASDSRTVVVEGVQRQAELGLVEVPEVKPDDEEETSRD